MDKALNEWFAREILTHEAALVRYLARAWPHRDDIHDLRQEVYMRVYEAAKRARPHSPKSFLFATARHLMADRIRRNRIVSMQAVGDLDALNVPVEEASPEERLHARQELAQLARAFGALPPRCRDVVWLRRVDELSQKEVAGRLNISEKTVESHIVKGTRLLADLLFGRKAVSERGGDSCVVDGERAHGKQHRD